MTALASRLLAEADYTHSLIAEAVGDRRKILAEREALLREAAAALSAREAVAADWKMEVKPSASDAEILTYLDELLDVQGRLMFAKGNAPEPLGEVFGVAILDFMRLHGMRVREIIRAATSLQPGGGWRPIAEAPAATPLLLWTDDGMRVGMRYDSGWCQFGADDDLWVISPTHFQPLPAAPSAEAGES